MNEALKYVGLQWATLTSSQEGQDLEKKDIDGGAVGPEGGLELFHFQVL